jgi:hypothetical protein
VLFSSLLVPVGSFLETIFLFFDFNGCREFSIAISFTLSYFLKFTVLFFFVLRTDSVYRI